MSATDDLHPTVQACVLRSFCDATYAAAERRMDRLHQLDKEVDRLVAERDEAEARANRLELEAEAARTERNALRTERDQAIETRENANTVSVRVEGENKALELEVQRLTEALQDIADERPDGKAADFHFWGHAEGREKAMMDRAREALSKAGGTEGHGT